MPDASCSPPSSCSASPRSPSACRARCGSRSRMLAVMGATDQISVFIRQTLVQIWTPDALRGRVTAVNSIFIGASNELGAFRAGTVATVIGVVPAVILGGIGTVAVAARVAEALPGAARRRPARRPDRRAPASADAARSRKQGTHLRPAAFQDPCQRQTPNRPSGHLGRPPPPRFPALLGIARCWPPSPPRSSASRSAGRSTT